MKPIQDAAASLPRRWRRKKVITLSELMEALHTSLRTVRRRLKAWGALASFNHNSRFYTLPELPQFDEHGLWFHRQIGFSRHGHLPQTIVALVLQSPGGLTAAELGQPLRLDPRSFLWPFHQHPSLQREKHQGHYVYFAADPAVAARQKAIRTAALTPVPLPSAEETIAVLVQAIQHPDRSPEQWAAHLQATYPHLSAHAIVALFAHHHLTLKKTPRPPGSTA
ncbi:MAG TPA: hypothetical protein VI729_06585 [Anaerolineales bacterium]|nr:hypothetical protein [Anaerolineales bacterium]